jgi:GtrA-like protein
VVVKNSVGRRLSLKQFATKGIKFAFIGAVGTGLNLGILYALTTYLRVYYLLSELIAIVIVFAFNYVGNILVGNIRIDADPASSPPRPPTAPGLQQKQEEGAAAPPPLSEELGT